MSIMEAEERLRDSNISIPVVATTNTIFILPDKELGFKEYIIKPDLHIVEIPFAFRGDFVCVDPFHRDLGCIKNITMGLASFFCYPRETTLSFESKFKDQKNAK